jgi:hypothetical protein
MNLFLRRLVAAVLGLGISLVGVNSAFAANLTWTADQTIYLDGTNIDLTIVSGSVANSFIINSGSIQVVVGNGDVFTVRSSSRGLRVPTTVTSSVSNVCASGVDTIAITGDSSAETITLTPNSTACSNSSGGGGGGGGSQTRPTTPTTTPTTPVTSAHAAGSVIKGTDGTVYFIPTGGATRLPFTSAGAFQSYGFLSWGQVMDANTADMSLPVGSFIAPRDGSIFCASVTKGSDVKGECSLITGGMKAAFTSSAVFAGQGFSFKNAIYGDSSFLTKTSNIASSTDAHRTGVLINTKGLIQLVGSTGLVGIPSMAVLDSWGYNTSTVVKANAADTAKAQNTVMYMRSAGELNPSGL